jgi:hypothetical protein
MPDLLHPRNYLLLWLFTYAIIIFLARRKRNKTGATDEQIFLTAGFSLGGAFALLKVALKVIFDEKLQAELDWDGVIAIIISCGLGIFLSIKEIRKLF